jgi:uncharacterized protein (TIGR03032 family)
VLIDVEENRIVLEGLSMPHSPRWYRDRLWLEESGDGGLGWIDPGRGYRKLAELPGFTRGLDFAGPVAFVGLSQVRETAIFSGLPLTERPAERFCGVYAVDLETGRVLAFLHFTAGVREVFAVQVLPGTLRPELLTETTDLIRQTYILPDDALGCLRASPGTPVT